MSRFYGFRLPKARNMFKIFSLIPSKKTRGNWDKLSVYFSIFEWSKHQFCQIAKCQMAFYGIGTYLTINLVIQKWRSKHFVFSQFSLATCFFREWEKIFYTYFRPRTTDAQWGNHLNCMHGRKSNPNPKFIGTTEAYFVCHTGPKLQVS